MPVTIDELDVDVTPAVTPEAPAVATTADDALQARRLEAQLAERDRLRARLLAD
jgi:hypothetical protein